jgi:hypothetical protein
MRIAGYTISSKVSIIVDPNLSYMGYAKQKEGSHCIVVADWALDSEMLGGFVLHELSHIFATEREAPSHDAETLDLLLKEMRDRDGLNDKEVGFLVDAFNHLQNVLVDDIVFKVMTEKELKMATRFFAGWVTMSPAGNPVQDAALLTRNAFAAASLRRRGLYDGSSQMARNNKAFISALGDHIQESYEWLVCFLEGARSDWSKAEFDKQLREYLEKVLSIMRETPAFNELR